MQCDFSFRLMSLEFRLRDFFRPPERVLIAAGVRNGMTVLDFGCGPGGFALAAAKLVGPEGRVYAADNHPLAVKSVQRAANRQSLGNIRTILGSSVADLPGGIVDMTLLYDVIHELQEPGLILEELHRVLKPRGVLSVSDHHLEEEPLLSMITGGGLFLLAGGNRGTFQFKKNETREAAA
jgi:ubiquinone/menaquinone biosynthesis C-methylase UbiE